MKYQIQYHSQNDFILNQAFYIHQFQHRPKQKLSNIQQIVNRNQKQINQNIKHRSHQKYNNYINSNNTSSRVLQIKSISKQNQNYSKIKYKPTQTQQTQNHRKQSLNKFSQYHSSSSHQNLKSSSLIKLPQIKLYNQIDFDGHHKNKNRKQFSIKYQKVFKKEQSKEKIREHTLKAKCKSQKINKQQYYSLKKINNINDTVGIKSNIIKKKSFSYMKPVQKLIKKTQASEKSFGLKLISMSEDKIIISPVIYKQSFMLLQKYHKMILVDSQINFIINSFSQIINSSQSVVNENNFPQHLLINSINSIPKYFVQNQKRQIRKNFNKNINTQILKIQIKTKSQILIDIGFASFFIYQSKVIIFRFYISKIYRKKHYTMQSIFQLFTYLIQRKEFSFDKISFYVYQKNFQIQKFLTFIGFKIEKIKSQMNEFGIVLFQEFTINKNQIQSHIKSNSIL